MTKKKRNTFPPRFVSLAFPPPSHLKGMLMLHFYTTDNITQNQEAYNTLVITHEIIFNFPCLKIIYFFIYFNSVLVYTIIILYNIERQGKKGYTCVTN